MKPTEKKAVIPDRLYLQIEDEGGMMEDALHFTHCSDRINESDVVYVREELNPSPLSGDMEAEAKDWVVKWCEEYGPLEYDVVSLIEQSHRDFARHVCGLQGFGQSTDDECPACRLIRTPSLTNQIKINPPSGEK